MTTPTGAISAARFALVIDGHELAVFAELAGLSTDVEPQPYLESNAGQVVQSQLPGKLTPPSVTLRHGTTGVMEMWAWHERARNGDMVSARRSCSLVMYDSVGKPVARFWMANAWPKKIEITALKAGDTEVLTEAVTLVCESLQRVAP